jgi:DNA-binding MarR family transcriptional regulator
VSARETAELLVQVGRRVQAEGYDGGPSPVQWMALRFLARANQFSRNPSAFAGFQATTRGTATQTIKSLEAGGYLVRQPSKADRRSVSLRLTSKGKKALARDPFEVLVRAVDSLDAKDRSAMRLALVFVRTARTSAERCAATRRARAFRPLNACSSLSRFNRRTWIFYASIFSQTSTAMAHRVNVLTSAICGKNADDLHRQR